MEAAQFAELKEQEQIQKQFGGKKDKVNSC